MAIGEINKELKQEIDDVQLYIDYLWEQGRGSEVPAYRTLKDSLCKKIKPCQANKRKSMKIAGNGSKSPKNST